LSKINQERREKAKEWRSESKQAVSKPSQRKGFKVLTNAPSFREHAIRDEYIKLIRSAEKSICLNNPYFFPGRKFIRELGKAVERGVEVKVMLPLRTDHSSSDALNQACFKKILARGARLFLYNKPGVTFIHAKTLSVDGKYGTIGSSNLDYLSLSMNCEINFFFANTALAQELEKQFEKDLQYCQEKLLREHLEEVKKEGTIKKSLSQTYHTLNGFLIPRQQEYQ